MKKLFLALTVAGLGRERELENRQNASALG